MGGTPTFRNPLDWTLVCTVDKKAKSNQIPEAQNSALYFFILFSLPAQLPSPMVFRKQCDHRKNRGLELEFTA
jgi:hypothetical protein